jgi:hypothetical protein
MAIRTCCPRVLDFIGGAVFIAFLLQAGEIRAVTLAWNPNPESDLAGYRLFWGETNSAATMRDVGKTTQTQVTNLVAGRNYYFYLTAYNTSGLESNPSSTVYYTQPQPIPAAPSNLAGIADSDTQIRLQWRDNSTNETGFRLLRKAGVSGAYSTIPLAANATSYADTGLTGGTQYFYKIHAYNASGNSAESSEISITTPAGPPPVSVNTAASFVRSDWTSSGSWRGRYGLQGGLAIPYGTFAIPSYVQLSAYQNYPLTWANPTTDPRALAKTTGTDHFATAFYWTNYVHFYLRFKDTAVHQVSLYFLDFDRQGRRQKLEFFDLDTGKLLGTETIADFENGVYSTWDLRGNVRIRVTALAGPNCVLNALFFDAPAKGSASFVGSDSATSGSWRGVYGSEGGSAYPYGIINPPSYVKLSAWQNYPLLWSSSTTDPRALQRPSGSDRFAGAWHGTNFLFYYLNFQDTNTHQVSFYFVDYDRVGRQQRFELFDNVNGNLLATTNLSNFENGIYLSWNLRGSIRLKLTPISGPICLMSAMFFDPPGANSATFLGSDTATSGTWKGVYGSAGQTIAAETAALPSYASATFSDATATTWSANTTDPTALERPVQSGRIASSWSNARQYTVALDFTDDALHEVSFYFVDFDNRARVQVVDIIDPVSGMVLDSTELENFRSGIWLSYGIKGSVDVRITSLGTASAVLSGIFFD